LRASAKNHTGRQLGRGGACRPDLDDLDDLDDLAEYTLRILQSFTIDPGRPARTGELLRAYLRRWIAPVLSAEKSPTTGRPGFD
jgi:hypothetical protein